MATGIALDTAVPYHLQRLDQTVHFLNVIRMQKHYQRTSVKFFGFLEEGGGVCHHHLSLPNNPQGSQHSVLSRLYHHHPFCYLLSVCVAAIPFIIHPIDNGIHAIMNPSFMETPLGNILGDLSPPIKNPISHISQHSPLFRS